jgi:hypothetical protein
VLFNIFIGSCQKSIENPVQEIIALQIYSRNNPHEEKPSPDI